MKKVDYLELGKRIKDARENRKLTQEQLSELVNLSSTHISNIETAHTKVSLSSLILIANELKVSLDDLLCDSLLFVYDDMDFRSLFGVNDCTEDEIAIISDVIKSLCDSFKRRRKH